MPSPPETMLYSIGSHQILLPANHALPSFQAQWKRYDVALGEVARIIGQKYPDATIIDIGANIGDSAALLCKYRNFPLLCVEGNRAFGTLLTENILRIGGDIEIEHSFIGPDGVAVAPDQILDNAKGSSRVLDAPSGVTKASGDTECMISLHRLLEKHPRFSNPRLIKIDTDGYDFFIIRTSYDVLSRIKPVVFYECAPFERAGGPAESIEAFQTLIKAGYRHFIIYDNFGNYLIHLDDKDTEKFFDLIIHLISNGMNGPSIYYYDICAFHEVDSDIFRDVRSAEIAPFIKK